MDQSFLFVILFVCTTLLNCHFNWLVVQCQQTLNRCPQPFEFFFPLQEEPSVIKSYYDKRIVGCPGGEGGGHLSFLFLLFFVGADDNTFIKLSRSTLFLYIEKKDFA